MQTEELRLDGNAAGGILRDVFTHDMTAAVATCAGCGARGPVGELLEYGQPMGIVLRCPACDAAVLRVVRRQGLLQLDPSGVRMLAIPESGPPS
jgi:hypothetical protein